MSIVRHDYSKERTFGFELDIGQFSGTRHELRIHIELAASSSDQMAVLSVDCE